MQNVLQYSTDRTNVHRIYVSSLEVSIGVLLLCYNERARIYDQFFVRQNRDPCIRFALYILGGICGGGLPSFSSRSSVLAELPQKSKFSLKQPRNMSSFSSSSVVSRVALITEREIGSTLRNTGSDYTPIVHPPSIQDLKNKASFLLEALSDGHVIAHR